MIKLIKDILPKISRFSKKLDELTLLINQHWVRIYENSVTKEVLIFRNNSELIMSTNGKVEMGRWEYLGNNSMLIVKSSEITLFNHGFFDTTILILKIDGILEYACFINETKIGRIFNTQQDVIDYLYDKYIHNDESIDAKINIRKLTEDMNPIKGDNGLWGYLDRNGNIIIDYIFESARMFKDGHAVIELFGKYGMIDVKGNYVISPKYEFMEPFSEGLALARKDRNFGYIDCLGVVKIDFQYDHADSFEGGFAKVKLASKVFYINRNNCSYVNGG